MYITDENIQCAKCGYRLKGLQDPGTCPDCGGRFHTARNLGIKVFKRSRNQLTGTNVLVAIITGMCSIIFLPCTAFAWLVHIKSNDPNHKAPLGTTFIATFLLVTFLTSLFLAIREFWLIRKANQTPEE